MSVVTETFDAILFDMDGTLIDSTAGVVGAWSVYAERFPFLNIKEILNTSHGVRTIDNLRTHCGMTDPVELEAETVRFEEEIVNTSRKNGVEGIVILPGVRAIIDSLHLGTDISSHRWAICTSATRTYASAALQIAGIPIPTNFVTAEDVTKGKPSPDPYLLGAGLCGVDPKRCLVLEDTPAGIASGRDAGAKTLAVITTHNREVLQMAKPDFLVKDLSSVSMKLVSNGVEVTVTTTLAD